MYKTSTDFKTTKQMNEHKFLTISFVNICGMGRGGAWLSDAIDSHLFNIVLDVQTEYARNWYKYTIGLYN